MSSGVETHKKGASNIEIDENTVAEGEPSKNTVSNYRVQDFNFLPMHLCHLRNHQSTVTT